MIKVSWLLFFIIIPIFCSGNDFRIGNAEVTVSIFNNVVSIESKTVEEFKTCKFELTGQIDSVKKVLVKDRIWGEGERLSIYHDKIFETTLTLYSNNPFLHATTIVSNRSNKIIEFSKFSVATILIPVKANFKQLKTLGTGGLKPIESAEGSFTYSLLTNPENQNAVLTAWLTQLQGIGTVEPQLVKQDNNLTYKIGVNLDFGYYKVNPGEDRGTDIMLLGFFEDGRKGLELYGSHLAKVYDIKLPPKPNVYCTWYHRDLNGSGASTEKDIQTNAIFAAKNLAPFGLDTFQIDDHWQSSMIDSLTAKNIKLGKGPIKSFSKSNFNYPLGMANTAKNLNQQGFTSGIWFMPFAGDVRNPYFDKEIFAKNSETGLPYEVKNWSGTCIDATSPKGELFLRERFKRIYDWGYRYFKIDGLHTGAPSENIYVNRAYEGKPIFGKAKIYNQDMTFVQAFRRGISILREEAPKTFLLGCTVTQNMLSFGASFGMVDAMRVGPDNDSARKGVWSNVTKGAHYSGNLYFLNNKVWYNDPDPCYVRESNPIEKARWMVSWQAISGVMGTSSMQYSELSKERLDLLKRALPTHDYNAYPVDILENENPNIWIVNNNRMNVIGLFNWKEKEETTINYNMKKMGLDPNLSYEAFDFWDNKYLGTIKGSLKSILKPASCQVLAVKPVKNNPQVISTSRHITQGLMDVITEKWEESTKTLLGTSKVVENDIYELRIVLPKGFSAPKNAMCNGRKMDAKVDGSIVRISFIPTKTDEVNWKIIF